MEEYSLDNSFFINASSGSKGSQLKYKFENKWFKIDTHGYEGIAESLACDILEASNCHCYVKYHRCTINGRSGCYSENFLSEDEQLITFENLYYMNTGRSLTEEIAKIQDVSERILFVKVMVQNYTGLDVSMYVDTLIALDFIIRNGDRHLNNMAVIASNEGYREAPVYDNGDAFFSSYQKFEPWLTLDECMEKCTARPFSGSFHSQFSNIKNPLKIDYKYLMELLQKQADSRGKQAALYLLNKYRNEFEDKDLK